MASRKLAVGKLKKGTIRAQRFAARDISFTLQECEFCDPMTGHDTTCGVTICTVDAITNLAVRLSRLDATTLSALIGQVRSLQKTHGKGLDVTLIAPGGKFVSAAAKLKQVYKTL